MESCELVRKTLSGLNALIKSGGEKCEKALLTGRFSRKMCSLEHTVIMGEDGGLFLLLNKRDEENLGSGGFGRIHLGMSLVMGKCLINGEQIMYLPG